MNDPPPQKSDVTIKSTSMKYLSMHNIIIFQTEFSRKVKM